MGPYGRKKTNKLPLLWNYTINSIPKIGRVSTKILDFWQFFCFVFVNVGPYGRHLLWKFTPQIHILLGRASINVVTRIIKFETEFLLFNNFVFLFFLLGGGGYHRRQWKIMQFAISWKKAGRRAKRAKIVRFFLFLTTLYLGKGWWKREKDKIWATLRVSS